MNLSLALKERPTAKLQLILVEWREVASLYGFQFNILDIQYLLSLILILFAIDHHCHAYWQDLPPF